MSKYIDKDELWERLQDRMVHHIVTNTLFNTIKAVIDGMPTIDIVNCIECAYLGDDWWCYKHEFTPIPIEDYFCKDGERRDNG